MTRNKQAPPRHLSQLPEGRRKYHVRQIMTAFSEAGVKERTRRLCHLSVMFDRVITSVNELTTKEVALFTAAFWPVGQDGRKYLNTKLFAARLAEQDPYRKDE